MFSKISENKVLILLIVGSLAIKFALFGYLVIRTPSSKFMPDTPTYIEPGVNLIEKGVFATFNKEGEIEYEISRTPGYPIFLAFINKTLKLSFDYVILVQILLVTLAGYIVYKAASELDKKIALLASFIFLFDLPVAISTLMLLSEALYTFFMAIFMYLFLKYLRDHRASSLVLSVLIFVIATYIRPINYYLGLCLGAGIIYALFRVNPKKAITHALMFLLLFYASLGLWQYRNYIRTGDPDFTTIDNADLLNMGFVRKYEREGGFERVKISPLKFYASRATKSIIQFFTLPGTLKYLGSVPIKIASKIYGYPWVAFWLIGLPFARYRKLSYLFLLLTVLYFMTVTVIGTGLVMGSRFRATAMPLISILSASGWFRIKDKFRKS